MTSFLFVGGALAVDLMNTVVAMNGRTVDLLPDWEGLVAWGAAAGVVARDDFPKGRQPGAKLDRFRRFREDLRRGLVGWARSGRPSAELVALINRCLARDPQTSWLGLRAGSLEVVARSTAAPLDRLYAAVARSAAELAAHGDPKRFRKCASPACILWFYDRSKPGRRRWHSMESCGNRAKVRAHYRRARARGRHRYVPGF